MVNPIVEHIYNLITPSTPYLINSIFDPFQSYHPNQNRETETGSHLGMRLDRLHTNMNVGFMRGYPHSLRSGVRTVISHGLWVNKYDRDRISELHRQASSNGSSNSAIGDKKYMDVTMTVPNGSLFLMSTLNLVRCLLQ